MVVIGGGAAGMVTGASSAIFGAKTCMIERNLFGGDCLFTGCVPSKAFLKACNVAYTVRNCAAFGIEVEGTVKVDFAKVMERMRSIRAEISEVDSASHFAYYYGLDVFLGHAEFIDRNKIRINN